MATLRLFTAVPALEECLAVAHLSCRRLKTLLGLVAPTPAGLESRSGSTQGDGRGVFRQKRLYSLILS